MLISPSCGDSNSIDTSSAHYDFDNPSSVFKLAKDLREISGLSLLSDSSVVAIQDEKGVLFELSLADGAILRESKFGKSGDYEGVEVVGDSIYALTSSGDLYSMYWHGDDVSKPNKSETFLSSKYDTEGLGFASWNNTLLIAAKEYAGADLRSSKSIFAFDVSTKELSTTPTIIVKIDSIAAAAHGDASIPQKMLLRNWFKPSALAIDPLSNFIYILSSSYESIVVLDTSASIVSFDRLDPGIYPQPEGIAFKPNGDLIIASEGDGGRGRLVLVNRTLPQN